MLTPLGLPAPTLLHGGVGVYGLLLLAIAIALHPSPTPAVDSDPVAAGIRRPMSELGDISDARVTGMTRSQ